jgi:arylsulfatase
MLDGRPAYTYNWVGLELYTVTSTQRVTPGKHTLRFEFAYEGGRGGGGKGTIYRDGVKVGEGAIKNTNSNTFGIDESADVGMDENTPVFPAYHGRDRFTGKIGSITIETRAQ